MLTSDRKPKPKAWLMLDQAQLPQSVWELVGRCTGMFFVFCSGRTVLLTFLQFLYDFNYYI